MSAPQRRRLVYACATLVAAMGCGAGERSTGPHTGGLQITVTSAGTDVPADSYRVVVNGAEGPAVSPNGAVGVAGLEPGEHQVELAAVPLFCTAQNPLARSVVVRSEATTQITYELTCVRRLAFSQGDGYSATLHFIGVDGTHDTALTLPSISGTNDAAWSPDGATIVFWAVYTSRADTALIDGRRDIYVLTLDGSSVVRLTHDAGANENPAWSPDGSRIAFDSDRRGAPRLSTRCRQTAPTSCA